MPGDGDFFKKPELPKEAPKGRRVCAWCKKDMGPAGTEEDSHGICENCEKNFDYDPEKVNENQPGTLDVVSIDGRWAQVIDSHLGASSDNLIVWLDGKEPATGTIDFSQCNLTEKFDLATVGKFQDQFTQEEIERVHWGSEQGINKDLKLQVRVFGKYTKKP